VGDVPRVRKGFDLPPSTAFWTFVSALLACSFFFAFSVESRRRGWDTFIGVVPVQSGEVVTLHRVIDGDEVSLTKSDGKTFVLRLIGIKCFDPRVTEAGIGAAGQNCVSGLEQMVSDETVQLVVDYEGELARDDNDRVLAYLRAGDRDVGQALVSRGLGMAFVRYPFAREEAYLAEQVAAKNEGRGLWSNPKASQRADALYSSWMKEREDGAP
jgi:endonuclease YncB( thermonuclease family)